MTLKKAITPGAAADRPNCWKAAELRGIYPHPISCDLFSRVGAAVGAMLGAGAQVLVAGDFRLSTPLLKEALTHALLGTGVDVLDGGQIPTPVAYFAATVHKPDAVLMVTASHNPPEHNGLKLLLGGWPPTPDQLAHIRELSSGHTFPTGKGTITRIAPLDRYEQFMIERWRHLDPVVLPNLILDAGNGAWSESAPRIFSALNLRIERISCKIDGRFPDRPSDCSRPANLITLREQVVLRPNTVGIAWDGDGDRVALVDETGRAVSSDQLSMLLVREFFASGGPKEAGKTQVVVDMKLASTVQREVLRLGGHPLLEKTGHAFMRTRMLASGARLGLDACGHFFFGELQGADDGLFAAMRVLEILQRARSPLSELINNLPTTYGSPELRIPLQVLAFRQAEEVLFAAFPSAPVERLDGIRIALTHGTVLLRESGTEAVLSLRIEGDSQAGYEMLLATCLELFPAARGSIQSQMQEHLAAAVLWGDGQTSSASS